MTAPDPAPSSGPPPRNDSSPGHDDAPTRRSVVGWLAVLPVVGAAFPTLRALLTSASGERPASVFLCNKFDVPAPGRLLPRNLVFEVRSGPRIERIVEPAFVGRREDGSIYAISGVCPHLGCPVMPAAEEDAPVALRCPCHAASFDVDGRVLDGPPKQPLRTLELEVPEGSGPIRVLNP